MFDISIIPTKEAPLMNIYTGTSLKEHCSQSISPTWKKRWLYPNLLTYLKGEDDGKVCCLYGLQKTGKRVMMLQAISELDDEHCLLIECERDEKGSSSDTMYQVIKAVDENPRCNYIFLYEIAALKGVVDVVSAFVEQPDFAGKKFVMAGTDSLAFFFAGNDSLYEKVHFIHTTHCSSEEYLYLLQGDLSNYIKRGGTLTNGAVFEEPEQLNAYIRTAIAYNIAHTFEHWKQGRNFDFFHNMEGTDQLADFIMEVISVYNKKFLLRVIRQDLESSEAGSILDIMASASPFKEEKIDAGTLSENIKISLFYDMKEPPFYERPFYKMWHDNVDRVTKYLQYIDVLYLQESLGATEQAEYCFTQPGIQYWQAHADAEALVKSEVFEAYSDSVKREILKRIEQDICKEIYWQCCILQNNSTSSETLKKI
jgi:hypothetical protein